MQQIVKLETKIMDRTLWLEIKETDKDPEFLKKKIELALNILLDRKEPTNEDR